MIGLSEVQSQELTKLPLLSKKSQIRPKLSRAILATLNQKSERQGQAPESVNDGARRRQGAFVDG